MHIFVSLQPSTYSLLTIDLLITLKDSFVQQFYCTIGRCNAINVFCRFAAATRRLWRDKLHVTYG